MKKDNNTVKPRRVKAVATITTQGIYSPGDPIWSIPRTRAAYDAMVEQMADAAAARILTWPVRHTRAKGLVLPDIITVLRAIGITRPKEDKP